MPPLKKELPVKYDALCKAIRRRDIAKARKLLLDNAPVNASFSKFKLVNYNSPLHLAVGHLHGTEFISMLLDKGAGMYSRNGCNQTALYIAVALNREDIVDLFFAKKMYINEDLCSLIMEATAKNNIKLVKLFVEHGIKDHRFVNVFKAVDTAVQYGHMDILNYLLDYCKTHKQNNHYVLSESVMNNGSRAVEISDLLLQHGFTIFSREDETQFLTIYAAVKNKSHKIVKHALELGIVDPNIYNKITGQTFLHAACINRDAEMVKLLIEHKAHLNLRILITPENHNEVKGYFEDVRFHQLTPLRIAILISHVEIAKLVIVNGADLIDKPKEYPLLISAIQLAHPEIMKTLINHGADVNVKDNFLRTPLHYSVANRYRRLGVINLCPGFYQLRDIIDKKEIIELLIQNGADPNSSEYVHSPLQTAVIEGYHDIAQLFLNYGADINYAELEENTAVHLAINYSDSAMLDLLLKHNPNLSAVNIRGLSALHVAALDGKHEMLEQLIKGNADVDVANHAGNTALHTLCYRCRSYEHLNSTKILLKFNANVNAKNLEGCTPLHTMSLRKSIPNLKLCIEMIESLFKNNADVNSVENLGGTPLTLACINKHFDIIKVLLKHGANINSSTKDGRTSLHWAVLQDNADVFEFLIKRGADINILCKNQRTAFAYIFSTMRGIDILVRRIGLDNPTAANARFNMYNTARNHIIKLKCTKVNINRHNQCLINSTNEMNAIAHYLAGLYGFKDIMSTAQVIKQCNKEIQNIKRLGLPDLSAFLTKSIREIAQMARNKQLAHAIQSKDFDIKFPHYSSMIKDRFAKAVKMNRILDIGEKFFVSFVFHGMPLLCVDHIFGYLNFNDIKNFISAIK